MHKKLILALFACVSVLTLKAQDDDLLSDDQPAQTSDEKVNYAFKTTRVVNGQSIEMLGAGVLDFKMNHRFGALNAGPLEAFGLDQATMRLGLDYGITNNWMFGVGRSNIGESKSYDVYTKYRLIQQTRKKIPVTVEINAGGNMYIIQDKNLSERMSNYSAYFGQLIIGRKFSERFSLQFSPTVLMAPKAYNYGPIYAVGIGMREKLTPRLTLNAEYQPILNSPNAAIKNGISVGFDIETGGHVFQLHFTNCIGLNEYDALMATKSDWSTGGVRFGFNLSRVFTVVDPTKKK